MRGGEIEAGAACSGNRARDLRYLHSATFAPYVVPFRHCPAAAPGPARRLRVTLIDAPAGAR